MREMQRKKETERYIEIERSIERGIERERE